MNTNVKKHIMLISSSIKNLNEDTQRRPCRPPSDSNSSRQQARRQPKQPMLPTAPRSGRGFANEKQMLANCHAKHPSLQMPALALPSTTYQVCSETLPTEQLSSDPRVRSVLNSKNCAVVISTESSPVKEGQNDINALNMMSLTELISKGSCSSQYSGGQTFRTRDHNSSKTTARGQEEVKQSSWFLSIRGIKDNPAFDGSPQFGGRENAQTAPVSPIHSAEVNSKQSSDAHVNQRYNLNEHAQSSIFQLDQDTPIAPVEASFCEQSSRNQNSKFLLNESVISELEKLNDDSGILTDQEILKQAINKNSIIQYEEVKESKPTPRAAKQTKPRPRTFQTKLKPPTSLPKTPKRQSKITNQTKQNQELKRPTVRPVQKVVKPRGQYHARSKSDFIGQLKQQRTSKVAKQMKPKPEPRKLFTPNRRKNNLTPKKRTQDSAISEKENVQHTSPLKRSEKKVLGTVVNTLFSNTMKPKSKSKTDLQQQEGKQSRMQRSMSPLGFKPHFGRTTTVCSNPAPPQKLQLHYCL